ncbi:hypothetical protein K490DRAFT_57726 [Saccharata proteae CBS 121410]|uniref:Uncharacterized protein n=1 Tax=Saccharata proteae CBS 121410 TaxID=1314787 RepID=A0A9P4HR58_9PEZI|nr:hypothetical protein K490DRAFT_57726 [Saccharata proteae CBS 121410]
MCQTESVAGLGILAGVLTSLCAAMIRRESGSESRTSNVDMRLDPRRSRGRTGGPAKRWLNGRIGRDETACQALPLPREPRIMQSFDHHDIAVPSSLNTTATSSTSQTPGLQGYVLSDVVESYWALREPGTLRLLLPERVRVMLVRPLWRQHGDPPRRLYRAEPFPFIPISVILFVVTMSWFGSLSLAWKYALGFGILLAVTRRHCPKTKPHTGPYNDQIALTGQQKDEADLFGIRALEAGYYGGVAQSRPSSPAPSIYGSRTASMSTLTLVGGSASSKSHSPAISVIDVEPPPKVAATFPRKTPAPPLRKNAPPMLRLQPSEAELTGRINHNGVLSMKLDVPAPSNRRRSTASTKPSEPEEADAANGRQPSPSTFSDSSDSEADESISPTSPGFLRPITYSPHPPQLPVVDSVARFSWRPSFPSEDASNVKSTAVSMDYTLGKTPPASAEPSPCLLSPTKLSPAYMPRGSRHVSCSDFLAEPTTDGSRRDSFVRMEEPTRSPRRASRAPSQVYEPSHTRTDSTSVEDEPLFEMLPRTTYSPSPSTAEPTQNQAGKHHPRFSQFYDTHGRDSIKPSTLAPPVPQSNSHRLSQTGIAL